MRVNLSGKHCTPKVNFYVPLRNGGPKTWAISLAKELRKLDIEAQIKDTLSRYWGQVFDRSIVHSTLPFPTRPISGKYILTIHGDFTQESNAWARLYPLAIRMASIVTVPSNSLKDRLKLKNALIVENGIERPESIKRDFKISGTPKLGMLTNFDFRNKAQGVIELAKIARKAEFSGQIVIGGDGQHIDAVRKKTEAIFPGILFIGFTNKEEFFKKIDIFTYYSQQDNQPLALMEAMAAGIPLITNQIGATPEITPDGLIVKDNDEYIEKLTDLLENLHSRIRNSEAGRKAASRFFVDKVAQRWISIYQNV